MILPVAGPWHAMTSAGLPVSFEVGAGKVIEPRFRFKWGFCGIFGSELGPPVPIEPEAHWKYLEGQGAFIEATFVAPDRAEGTVTAPSRMLPGCPETHASFVAEPGPGPFAFAEAVVHADARNQRLVHAPQEMVLNQHGSLRFYGLHWRGFEESPARGVGRAYVKARGVVRRPRVTVTLSDLAEKGESRVYGRVQWVLRGPVPPGVRHQGERFLE